MSSSEGITLEDLAREIGAELKGDLKKIVCGLNSIEEANKDEVSFISGTLSCLSLLKQMQEQLFFLKII